MSLVEFAQKLGLTERLTGGMLLDLGCGQQYHEVIPLVERFQLSRYEGVDRLAEDDPSFSVYSLSSACRDHVEKGGCVWSVDELQRRISFHWNQDARGFLQELDRNFDVILMLNLLHMPIVKRNWREMLGLAHSVLRTKGVMVIEVFTDPFSGDLSDGQLAFSSDELSELKRALPGSIVQPGRLESKSSVVFWKD